MRLNPYCEDPDEALYEKDAGGIAQSVAKEACGDQVLRRGRGIKGQQSAQCFT